jgi:hypothetical protein
MNKILNNMMLYSRKKKVLSLAISVELILISFVGLFIFCIMLYIISPYSFSCLSWSNLLGLMLEPNTTTSVV